MDNFLIPLFSILFTIAFYPVLMLYVVIIAQVGVFSWLILAVMFSPIAALWYVVVRKRVLNYLSLLLDNKPRVWDIDKALDEYQEMLRS
jgi:membrane protein implicated in regulation of membrane protease activity